MLKTLLVDDNINYRMVLKSALQKHFVGMEMLEASGDQDALAAVSTFNPDLVIMDVDLKCDFTGLELCKIIKAEHPEIVIVILSQHDTPEYRAVAEQCDADIFFSKSTSLESIFDYVDSVIEKKNDPHNKASA